MTLLRSTIAGLLAAVACAFAGPVAVHGQGLATPPAPVSGPVSGPGGPAEPAVGQPEAAAAPAAFPATRELRASLDGSRAEIEQAEAAFRRAGLGSEELQDLRTRIEPVAERLRDQIAEVGPKLDAVRARLDQLGPKPKEGAPPEGAEVARDRAERDAAFADLDEVNRLARTLLLQAEQLIGQISDRRRAAFASALFQRSYSLVSPELWIAVASSFPRDLRALRFLAEDAVRRVDSRSSPFVLTLFGLAVGIGSALHLARRYLAPRLIGRDSAAVGVSPARKLLSALGILLTEAVPAAAGSLLIYQAAILLNLLPGRLVPVVAALLAGLAFLAFLQGLVDALFAPDRPAWRLVDLPERAATSISSLAAAFGVVVVAGKVGDAINQAIAAGHPLSVAVKGIAAASAALVLALVLGRLVQADPAADEACLGPFIPAGPAVAGPIRMLGWLLVGLVAAGALGGYIAFASFLVDQIVWVGSIGGLLYLALAACERLIGGTLKENSRVSTVLQANLGLRRRSLQQLGVLSSGIARVVLVVVAAMLALAPWGVESTDVTSSLRSAFFGFKVGDVTISLSTMMAALLCFVAVVAATRVVQRWLTLTFLPTTELDAGLRNSIATAIGYLGMFAAAAASFAYLGLSLEKIAIVAGALSVGIGFGLQSIVNNFVSGLILLWERPIRVGDLVVVGDGEGYVRRISVRATEIETFDRSTVIVPNSNLISGIVKNRVRNDSTGRLVLSVNVLRNQDPARAAELLSSLAGAHPDILREPAPRVFFKKIGDTWLEFDLVCYVDDVAKQLRVQSDLNFRLFKAFSDEGILPPLGPGATHVGGLEPLQTAIQQVAEAIGRHDGEVRRMPLQPAAEAQGRRSA